MIGERDRGPMLGITRQRLQMRAHARCVGRGEKREIVAAMQPLVGREITAGALKFFREFAKDETIGSTRIQFVPHQDDPSSVARYYQAADVYVHAAKADTFPISVIEAAACGLPVVATAVGGIPEQVIDGRTGFLVPAGDADAMAQRVVRLLEREGIRRLMAAEAQQTARERFDFRQQVRAYLDWYDSILVRVPSARALHHAN